MTLNAEQKAEIWHHYDTWMTGYLNADVETYDAYFDDDYHFIGSTNNEEFLNRKDTTKFFEQTGEQFAGITALRNETKILEVFGTSVFLTHVFDGWFLHDNEWTYYGRFRFSSVMQKKEAGWRFIYQHFSMPDLKSDEGQTIGYENITAENFELKEAIKRRTIELEVKNKELEIEAALERVRSRSMAMHHSDELNDVVAILFENLKELKIPFTAVGISIGIEDSKDLNSFVCGENEAGLVITNYRLPYFDHIITKDFNNVLEKQLDFFVGHYSKEEKDAFYEYVIEHTAEFRHLPEDIKRMIFESETYTISMVAVKNAVFIINDFEGKILAESEIDIIQRFARVFDQAYTRFLDLQKAEAQAREAQIEVAVERVRAQSMAMHHTDDLKNVTQELLNQLNKLKVDGLTGTSIYLVDANDIVTVWDMSSPGSISDPGSYAFSYDAKKYPILGGWVHTWRTSNLDYFVLDFPKEVLENAVSEMKELLPEMAVHIKNALDSGKLTHQWNPVARLSKGILAVDLTNPPTEDTKSIVTKMAGAFNLAYQRFLDLQKAQAQAREAQLEASLERVRAHAMGLRKSDELQNIITVIFEELQKLGLTLYECSIFLRKGNSREFTVWGKGNMDDGGFLTNYRFYFVDHPILNGVLRDLELKIPYREFSLGQEEIKSYGDLIFSQTDFKDSSQEYKDSFYSLKKVYAGQALFQHGILEAVGTEPLPGDLPEVLKRFSHVVDLTYTRFLDLQKAEAQTREAQINLAVERVRAKALAMFKSEEILQVVHKLKAEIMGLNIPNVAAATIHLKEPDGMCRVWDLTSLEIDSEGLHLPLDIRFRLEDTHPDFFMRRVWDNEAEYFVVIQEETDFKHTIQWLRDSGLNEQANEADSFFKSIQLKRVYHPTVHLNNGRMCIDLLDSPSAEVASILTKMAGAFDLAYKRFEDLQKAEAQTREAQIQLALERVRARTMAMKTQSDLLGVIELFGSQLLSLGLRVEYSSFINGTITKNRDWELWGYSPMSDEPPKKVIIPYVETAYFTKTAKNIEEFERTGNPIQVKSFTKEEKDAFFAHYWKFDPPVSDEAKNYLSATPGSMIIDAFLEEVTVSIVKFETEPYSEEQIDIFKRFSNEFRQTYIRFLDLQKAEAQARESQIQLALERVRARTMAMQHSSELSETSELLFKQIQTLGVPPWSCGFNIWEQGDTVFTSYMGSPDGTILDGFKIPLTEEATFIHFQESRDRGDKLFIDVLEGERLEEHYRYFFTLPGIKEAFEKRAKLGEQRPTFQINHLANFSHGNLMFITYEPCPEAHDIFIRFAKVFEQTYIRFLDLQKAEAQAREAQIEAALERVRSRSMAMHKTDELQEVVRVVAEELKNTGVILDTWGAVICTYFQDSKNVLHWTASGDPANPSIAFLLPYFKDELYDEAWASKNRGDSYFAKVFSFDVKNAFFKHAFEHSDYRQLPDDYKKLILESENHGIAWAWAKNSAIMIPSIQGDLPSEDEKEILIRFAKVFEQSFIRFLDLQKAEAQAKEAQIELSLERIRSQVTAMQESSDLLDIVVTMRTEFVKLGHEAHYFWHMRWLPERYDKAMTSGDGTKIGMVMTLPRHIHGDIPLVADWEKTKEPTVVLAMEVETAVDYVEKMITLGDFEQVDPQAPTLDDIRHIGGLTFVMARTTHGEIGYSLPGVVTNPPKDAVDTLVRFAGVFDLAYKRFEDLKAAERQHREAQIELALERVRARAMGMQHSDHLKDVIEVIGHQLHELGLFFDFVNFIVGDTKNGFDTWNVSFGQANPVRFFIPLINNRVFIETVNARINGLDFNAYIMTEEETFHFVTHLITNGILKYLPEDALQKRLHSKGMSVSTAVLNEVFLTMANYSAIPYTYEENSILKRFGNAFQQAFTRFLDLQKAEAQAREARIEAALEKVRSRTMAMRKSEELLDVASILFQEVKALGVPQWNCGFNIWEIGDDAFTYYPGTPDGIISQSPCKIPLNEHPVFQRFDASRKRGEDLLIYEKHGAEQAGHYQYMLSLPGVGDLLQSMLDAGFEFPVFQIDHIANFAYGNLIFITYEHFPEMHEVFKRFAKVFEQTYTRFLDLKRAEAQAREAQIEVALERTRTQSMLMQHSGELNEISKTFHEQLLLLGIDSEFSFVWLPDEEKNEHMFWATWVSDEDGVHQYHSRAINYPLDKTEPGTAACYVAWESGESVHETFVPPGEVVSFFATWEELLMGAEKLKPALFPEGLYYTEAYMKYGCFGIDIRRRLDADEKEIIRRFAVEFERTYTRFLDLKKAEAQALEAIKRASVDRVRAEIASMRTTTDLERIQPLIWNELTTLGVPFIRCGVFIMMEEKLEVQAFLSTPDGKSIAAFHLPYDATGQTKQIVAHWQQKQIFKDHMDEKAFAEYTQNLVQQGAVASDEKYVTENRPTDLYLHFLPFLQGMLYAGNDAPLNEDELQLVQNLADAFSTAYARYEDFNKLEAAKEQIEKTLVDLKQAQVQLIQAEKMASLGELTAGIAHEIQNPLNFVNNFSEVSGELVSEMVEEVDKGNTEEVKAIAKDLQQNLEKISHHGKRADAIVKGMLQHSRSSSGVKELTDINALADEYLRLAFHGLKAKDKSFNANFKLELDPALPKVEVIPQDIGRVLLNLIHNAFYAVGERVKSEMGNVKGDSSSISRIAFHFEPLVIVSTKNWGDKIEISIKDNGNGVPQKVLDKIFQPFFTTKPTGQGTGLGLSLSYDIVKAHGGELKVDTKEGEGSMFSMLLPI
jgi:signal transduction histidine kinase